MILQQALVVLIVVAAAILAVWRLPGAATRLRMARALQRWGGERTWLGRFGSRLAARELRAITAGGCAACSSRDTHAPPRR